MQITHNEVTAGLWLVVAVSSGSFGRFVAWRRFRRQLDEAELAGYDRGHDRGWRKGYDQGVEDESRGVAYVYDEDGYEIVRPENYSTRRTMLLEPGPTIYPALAALAQDALDEPESHAEPIDSTWLYKILLDWENRYPIPLDSPNGRMAEAI